MEYSMEKATQKTGTSTEAEASHTPEMVEDSVGWKEGSAKPATRCNAEACGETAHHISFGGDAQSTPLMFSRQGETPNLVFDAPLADSQSQMEVNGILSTDHFLLSTTFSRRSSEVLPVATDCTPIQVTCRTRDGRQTPYLTSPLSDVQMDLEFTSGNPYKFNFSGSTTPMQAGTPTCAGSPHLFPGMESTEGASEVQAVADGQCASKRSPEPADLPNTVVHRSLFGRCKFVPFPSDLSHVKVPVTPPVLDNSLALFIGQVRFEATPAEIIWLIHRTCGAWPQHLEGRGAGCYILYCKSEADMQLVCHLHKRLLFDVGGVWIARTAEEVDELCEYVSLEAPLLSRRARLPRDSMVVEELKLDIGGGSGAHAPRSAKNYRAPRYPNDHGNGTARGQLPDGSHSSLPHLFPNNMLYVPGDSSGYTHKNLQVSSMYPPYPCPPPPYLH